MPLATKHTALVAPAPVVAHPAAVAPAPVVRAKPTVLVAPAPEPSGHHRSGSGSFPKVGVGRRRCATA